MEGRKVGERRQGKKKRNETKEGRMEWTQRKLGRKEEKGEEKQQG